MAAPKRMSTMDLADRLLHAGVPVTGVVPPKDIGGDRLLVRGGLSVQDKSWDGGREYRVVLWHGFDPVTLETCRVLARCEDPFVLPDRIAEAAEALPAARAALLGENRDVADETRAKVRAVFDWRRAPHVVASTDPVDGALAVSMRGKAFTAWFLGARMTSFFEVDAALRRHWHGDARPATLADRFFPVDGEGLHLTASPSGLWRMSVAGTVRTAAGEEWFAGSYHRQGGDRGFWNEVGGVIGGDALAPAAKADLAYAVGHGLEPLYLREFDAFARDEVEEHERMAAHSGRCAAEAESAEVRLGALARERRDLGDLAVARAVREGGRPRGEFEVGAEMSRAGAMPGLLRAVPDREREM